MAWKSFSSQRSKQLRKDIPHQIGKKVHKRNYRRKHHIECAHTEYSQQTQDGKKIPYAYRTFAENYGKYAKKHKANMPIRRKPGEVLLEVDWLIDVVH